MGTIWIHHEYYHIKRGAVFSKKVEKKGLLKGIATVSITISEFENSKLWERSRGIPLGLCMISSVTPCIIIWIIELAYCRKRATVHSSSWTKIQFGKVANSFYQYNEKLWMKQFTLTISSFGMRIMHWCHLYTSGNIRLGNTCMKGHWFKSGSATLEFHECLEDNLHLVQYLYLNTDCTQNIGF